MIVTQGSIHHIQATKNQYLAAIHLIAFRLAIMDLDVSHLVLMRERSVQGVE